MADRRRPHERQLLRHLTGKAGQRVRHRRRDAEVLVAARALGLALLALDVAGVAELVDDAVALFVGEMVEGVDALDVEVRPAQELRDAFVLRLQHRDVRGFLRAAHAREARLDAALALVVEDAEAVGNRREALVDRVAA